MSSVREPWPFWALLLAVLAGLFKRPALTWADEACVCMFCIVSSVLLEGLTGIPAKAWAMVGIRSIERARSDKRWWSPASLVTDLSLSMALKPWLPTWRLVDEGDPKNFVFAIIASDGIGLTVRDVLLSTWTMRYGLWPTCKLTILPALVVK